MKVGTGGVVAVGSTGGCAAVGDGVAVETGAVARFVGASLSAPAGLRVAPGAGELSFALVVVCADGAGVLFRFACCALAVFWAKVVP